jgi:hypothetical protein
MDVAVPPPSHPRNMIKPGYDRRKCKKGERTAKFVGWLKKGRRGAARPL